MLGIEAQIGSSMKTTQVLKIALIPILAISTLLSISNTALADYLRSEGFGGEYRYELWSTDDGNDYYLKIWDKDKDPQTDSYRKTRSFKSSREALIHFDCNYAGKSLPECPK
ncbi:hypothetical protein [Trichormus sp. NMC-1]|uniref:hypothetical protein n=1 Tax=Trichormus sp. NMC-1 TaxID=1853259 RepID=UPI0009F32721|nr:hypothetical protein [Trichormus sp. NMC-1]